MRRCHGVGIGQIRKRWPVVRTRDKSYSEYAPAAPSPSDLKAPLPEKFSVGKNLKLKAILIQYEILAGSSKTRGGAASGATARPSSTRAATPPSGPSRHSDDANFRPLTPSGEKLVDEISGLLGGEGLRGMGRKLMADLKVRMGAEGNPLSTPKTSPAAAGVKQHQQQPPTKIQDSDPKAKYMEKLRKKTGGGSTPSSLSAAAAFPGGDADLFAARNLVSSTEAANLQSAWMLRQGAGDLLTYLAARSVRLGVIAGPCTTPGEFESFVRQLRQQSIRVAAVVSPEAMRLDGVAAGVTRAGKELGAGEGRGGGSGGRGAEVLVVGSSEPLLSAATAAEMFTARYRPPNSRPEGVIQNFTVRDIDEVRTIVEQVNGVSFRA